MKIGHSNSLTSRWRSTLKVVKLLLRPSEQICALLLFKKKRKDNKNAETLKSDDFGEHPISTRSLFHMSY